MFTIELTIFINKALNLLVIIEVFFNLIFYIGKSLSPEFYTCQRVK
ncbi:hypothetical protein [uncultured Eudoraea sp.]|nr:hypothetical protein [uncultured Eudoraea sp.]